MSYRATILSPRPSYGLGTMPGGRDGSTYTSYRRSGSASRKPATSLYNVPSSLSRPTSRPLPAGPGPLDTSGKRFNSYTSSEIKKSSATGSYRSPLKADHSYTNFDYTPSIGTLPRKYSPSTLNNTTKDLGGSRSIRSRSVSNADKLSDTFASNLKLNGGLDSVKASPRTIDSDDSIYGARESRKDRHEQNLNDSNLRTGSRVSRLSNNSIGSSDNSYISRNRDNTGRGSTHRDIFEDKRRDSTTDTGGSKSLSRQSSSGSISTGSSSKYVHGGKVGLRNIGNTCFMNSVLQCLSNTRPLLEYTLKEDYMLDINKSTSKLKGALVIAYANLITSFWKEKSGSYVSPNSFKSQIQKFAPRFSGYQQQDSQEFLRYLLEGLHEDVNKVTQKPKPLQINDDKFTSDSDKAAEYWNNYLRYDHSKIVEIFVGQLKSELKFECGHKSVTFDPFWDLSLPVPKIRAECDIRDCLSLFMKEESLEDDESPTCAKCKKRKSCTKRFSIQKFPPILVLHLKRFSQERYSRKITTLVNFPIKQLDLREFAAEKGQHAVYNLYAVSEHSGTTYGGHYTAKCKHPYTGEWNSFNDTHVSSCGANQAVSSEAYVLFFELDTKNSSHL